MDERTVVIADDHALVRRGLMDVIRQTGSFRVVADVADGAAALDAIRRHQPAAAVMDIEMPQRTGLEVAETLQAEGSSVPIVLLTMHTEGALLDRALRAGVRGYVLKDGALTDIVTCLNLVTAGRQYVSAELSGHLVARREQLAQAPDLLAALSETERTVLRLVARNLTTAAIAGHLGISPKTVENHRTRIAAKLDVHGPQALLRFALEHREQLQ